MQIGKITSKIDRKVTLPSGLPAISTVATLVNKMRGLSEMEQSSTGERVPMMALGDFSFGVDTLAYQEFSRRMDWRHASADRLGTMPAFQFVGPGMDSISLPGILMPELTGPNTSLDDLRAMAATGDAYSLVRTDGYIIGQYMIRSIDERQSYFLPGGGARRIEFGIELERAVA
ncbi:phage tail protein [Sphingopyxis yananensis]|uniref:phage tail protein n=1 Tax=Sphingopyxis yananensis TaxID=2886687 RepID=UPI001D108F4C|nr:phage tail protein [Sphingopyxis yananensis]MCC2602548.1 phage tail protein [Sphingopyxis yananensis]